MPPILCEFDSCLISTTTPLSGKQQVVRTLASDTFLGAVPLDITLTSLTRCCWLKTGTVIPVLQHLPQNRITRPELPPHTLKHPHSECPQMAALDRCYPWSHLLPNCLPLSSRPWHLCLHSPSRLAPSICCPPTC